ncbi:MAG: GYD domain-containing protein, partial [Acidobacteria bacterium]|nr:GYD domain-containing protein [Acidobacteriota bacterium]
MGKYLIQANYSGEGVKGLLAEGGSKRSEAAKAAIESVGGSLDCMYFAFGDTDVYAICDFPDDASAASVSLLINASGAVQLSLTPLLTIEDIDRAAEMSAA